MAAQKQPARKKCRTREHVIADLSVNFVERAVLRCGYTVERVTHDYGIDLLLFTYTNEGEIENGHVEVQLKAIDHLPLLADGQAIPFRVDVRDLNYWSAEPMPVILVVFDARNDRAYWLHIQRYMETIESRDLDAQEDRLTITVRIPTTNRLTVRTIGKLREFKEAVLAQVKGVAGHAK